MKNIPGAKPTFESIPAILKDMEAVLQSGRLILGPMVKAFEESFAEYVGAKHAIALSSCTAALQATLTHYDVKGCEVIVPTNTFIATAAAVIYAGGVPKLCDTDTDNLCAGPDQIKSAVNKKTKGVIIVHIGGNIHPRLDEIRTLCKEKGLFLIEDCAHAPGSEYRGKKAGNLTDAACFSFYPTKPLTTGTGGMVTTNDDALAETVRSLRHHGQGISLLDIQRLGNDWVMNEFTGVIGKHSLPHLDARVARRRAIAERYAKELATHGMPLLAPEDTISAYYKFVLILNEGIDRDALIDVLKKRHGIETGVLYWPTVDAQPIYQKLFNHSPAEFPNAYHLLSRAICPPMYHAMSDEDVVSIIQSFNEAIASLQG